MDASYPFEAVGNAHTPISHAHILWTFADLLLVYLLNFLHSKGPINRKREIQYVLAVFRRQATSLLFNAVKASVLILRCKITTKKCHTQERTSFFC